VSYEYWQNALEGRIGPIVETDPQNGFYRTKHAAGWKGVAIWRDRAGFLRMRVAQIPVFGDEIGGHWIACAKYPITEENYRQNIETGGWLTDPPADVKPMEPEPDKAAPPPPADFRITETPPPAGDNSGDPSSFEAMRAQLTGDIAEARSYYARHPIKNKTDADKCENWRKRIFAASKAFDEKRKAERQRHDDAIAEIQARYNPVLNAARDCAGAKGELDRLAQAWITAEQARLRQEAETAARARFEAERAAALAEQQRIKEEREAKLRDDPVAARTEPEPVLPPIPAAPEPVIAAPKVMIGTQGARRGAQKPTHTAVILDIEQAAAYYAAIKHPDLVELIQRLADAAARSKARLLVPGCRMSWEKDGKAA
jgi:hypothetical protein